MIDVARAADRGLTKTSWLDGRHTFSFNRYHNPKRMGFRALRVINDDLIAPGGAFGMHPHENMEILTWILEGGLAHQDSTGARGVIRPGDVQRMSAGTGIWHSESNASKTERVHLLQIWLYPERDGLNPGYEDTSFPIEQRTNRLRVIASPDAREGSAKIHQDATVYNSILDAGAKVEYTLAPGRHAWLQVGRGSVELNGTGLKEGDGAGVSEETALRITAAEPSEILLFDLA